MEDEPFDQAGPAGAPAVVLIHGVTANRGIWAPHARLLADRYRVISLDLPGHGALAGSPFRLEAAVDLLRTTLLAEAGGRALLVGDSLGGYVSMAFAGSHPGLAAALVLGSCTLPLLEPVGLAARIGAFVMSRDLAARLVDGALASMAATPLSRWPPLSLAEPLRKGSLLVRAQPDAFREVAGRDFRSMLGRYSGPVLFLNGERDVVFRAGERSFLRAAKDGRLQILAGAGHTASVEQPEAYVAAIRGFAESIGW